MTDTRQGRTKHLLWRIGGSYEGSSVTTTMCRILAGLTTPRYWSRLDWTPKWLYGRDTRSRSSRHCRITRVTSRASRLTRRISTSQPQAMIEPSRSTDSPHRHRTLLHKTKSTTSHSYTQSQILSRPHHSLHISAVVRGRQMELISLPRTLQMVL